MDPPRYPSKWSGVLDKGILYHPSFFVIAAEMFNTLMKRAVDLGLFEGIKSDGLDVGISHLPFADDTLVFCPARSKWLVNLIRIMECLQLLSSLKIGYCGSGEAGKLGR